MKYQFSNFQGLIDVVPPDRVRDCLMEMAEGLSVAALTADLTFTLAQSLAEKDGKKLERPDSILQLPEIMEWDDDGKREITIRMHCPEGSKEFLEINMTKKPEAQAAEGGAK